MLQTRKTAGEDNWLRS